MENLQQQIDALELALKDDSMAQFHTGMREKLEKFKAMQLEQATTAKTEKKKAAVKKEIQGEVSAKNPHKAAIDKATAALASAAMDEDSKAKLQEILNGHIDKANAWEKKQKQPKFKSTSDLTKEKKKATQTTKTKPAAPKPCQDDEPDPIEVEIDGKTYKIDECVAKYIKWYNQTYMN